jgi:hypothetical protein
MQALQALQDQFKALDTERRASAWREYVRLLQRLVDDQAVDPSEMQTVLELIGRSIGDVAGDVEKVRSRQRMRQQIAAADQARVNLAKAELAVEQLKVERQKFLDEINLRIGAAADQRDHHQRIVAQGDQAARDLWTTSLSPVLQDELAQCDTELSELVVEQKQAEFHAQRLDPLYIDVSRDLIAKIEIVKARRLEILSAMERE